MVVDEETGYRIFALEQALQPGDSLRLSFDVAFRPRGFRGTSGIQTAVVRNGSYFDRRLLPFIGYQPLFELSDAAARKRFGLAPRPLDAAADDAEARRRDGVVRNEDRVHCRGGRGHGRRPDRGCPGVAAPELDRERPALLPLRDRRAGHLRRLRVLGEVRGASRTSGMMSQLQIFHHPGHRYNVDRMIEGMKASLDYYTEDVRAVPVPPTARRRDPAVRDQRPRAGDDDRFRGAEVHHPRRRRAGSTDVLRDGARGRAQVVGRAAAGRPRARPGRPVGGALELQRHDGDREDPRPGGGPSRVRLPDGPLSQQARSLRARRPAGRGRGPSAHRLRQGRGRDVHAARAHRRRGRQHGAATAFSRSTATAGRPTRRSLDLHRASCAPSRPTRCSICSRTCSRRSRCGT